MFGMSKPKPKPGKKKAGPPTSHEQPEPTLDEQADSAVEVSLSLTPAQVAKLGRLGGAAWVGKQIDKAKLPD